MRPLFTLCWPASSRTRGSLSACMALTLSLSNTHTHTASHSRPSVHPCSLLRTRKVGFLFLLWVFPSWYVLICTRLTGVTQTFQFIFLSKNIFFFWYQRRNSLQSFPSKCEFFETLYAHGLKKEKQLLGSGRQMTGGISLSFDGSSCHSVKAWALCQTLLTHSHSFGAQRVKWDQQQPAQRGASLWACWFLYRSAGQPVASVKQPLGVKVGSITFCVFHKSIGWWGRV